MINTMNTMNTFTVTTQPYYDKYYQCYKNILMVNIEPQGPLRRLVRRIQLPRLSPFQKEGPCYSVQKCGLAIHSVSGLGQIHGCNLMTPDEIPDLISFLQANGYQIETQISNMLNQSEVKINNQRLVFTVSYYGANQPNIVYMR
jgi:hypothetical protein